MKRRVFLAGLMAAVVVGAARAQSAGGKVHRIAIVDALTLVTEISGNNQDRRGISAFFHELRSLRYAEGQNLLERFSGEGRADQYPELAREIVRRNPDLIFAVGNQTVLSLKAATATIPIVGIAADPVRPVIVPSLSRPCGNITGVSANLDISNWAKRLEFSRQAMPAVMRVGFLDSSYGWGAPYGAVLHEAVQTGDLPHWSTARRPLRRSGVSTCSRP